MNVSTDASVVHEVIVRADPGEHLIVTNSLGRQVATSHVTINVTTGLDQVFDPARMSPVVWMRGHLVDADGTETKTESRMDSSGSFDGLSPEVLDAALAGLRDLGVTVKGTPQR